MQEQNARDLDAIDEEYPPTPRDGQGRRGRRVGTHSRCGTSCPLARTPFLWDSVGPSQRSRAMSVPGLVIQ